MPPRPSHLPNHYERSALTKLAAGRELPFSKLFPAGRTTIAKLLEKGWIERAARRSIIGLLREARLLCEQKCRELMP